MYDFPKSANLITEKNDVPKRPKKRYLFGVFVFLHHKLLVPYAVSEFYFIWTGSSLRNTKPSHHRTSNTLNAFISNDIKHWKINYIIFFIFI